MSGLQALLLRGKAGLLSPRGGATRRKSRAETEQKRVPGPGVLWWRRVGGGRSHPGSFPFEAQVAGVTGREKAPPSRGPSQPWAAGVREDSGWGMLAGLLARDSPPPPGWSLELGPGLPWGDDCVCDTASQPSLHLLLLGNRGSCVSGM